MGLGTPCAGVLNSPGSINTSVNDPGNPFLLGHVPKKGQHSTPGPVRGSVGGHRVLLRKRNNIRQAV